MDIKKTEEKIKRETLMGEQRIEFSKQEQEEKIKSEKILERERIVSDELRREIKAMELDDNLKEEAKKKADKIDFLAEKDKIKNLLEVADEKGVVFAVKTAESMKDPFILDTFHDTLAKLINEGKEFKK